MLVFVVNIFGSGQEMEDTPCVLCSCQEVNSPGLASMKILGDIESWVTQGSSQGEKTQEGPLVR